MMKYYTWALRNLVRMAPDAGGGSGSGSGSGSDDAGTSSSGGSEGTGQGEEDKGDDPKTFTQEDVDKIIDKKFAQWQRKAEAESKKAIEAAMAEGERRAKLSAEERAKEEQAQREAEFANREAELTRKELRAQAIETMAKDGIPAGMADILNYSDKESYEASYETVKKAYLASVQEGVEARMKGKPPKDSSGGASDYTAQIRRAMGLK